MNSVSPPCRGVSKFYASIAQLVEIAGVGWQPLWHALVRGQIFLPFGRVYIPRLLFFPSLVCDPGNDTYKRMYTHTHTHAFETRRQVVERARYVSSANSFSSACEDKRTVQKATLPLRDTPRIIKRREERNYYVS